MIKNQAVRHSGVDLTAGKKRSSSSTDKLGFKTAFEQRDTNMRLTFDGKYDYETSNSLEKTHKYLLILVLTISSSRNYSGVIKWIIRRTLSRPNTKISI